MIAEHQTNHCLMLSPALAGPKLTCQWSNSMPRSSSSASLYPGIASTPVFLLCACTPAHFCSYSAADPHYLPHRCILNATLGQLIHLELRLSNRGSGSPSFACRQTAGGLHGRSQLTVELSLGLRGKTLFLPRLHHLGGYMSWPGQGRGETV